MARFRAGRGRGDGVTPGARAGREVFAMAWVREGAWGGARSLRCAPTLGRFDVGLSSLIAALYRLRTTIRLTT